MSPSTLLAHLSETVLVSPVHACGSLDETLALLRLHQPFSPDTLKSAAPASTANFLRQLDGLVLGKDLNGRFAGWSLAREIVKQGHAAILEEWGKAWVTGLVPLVGKSLPSQLVAPLVRLLEVLFLSSPALPSFHREVAVPWVQKFALGLMAWSTTSTSSQQTITAVIPSLPLLVAFHPASLRPLHQQLLGLSLSQLCVPATHASAAYLYSTLHLLPGKSASSGAYLADLAAAVGSAHDALDAVVGKVWEEEEDGAREVPAGGGGGIVWKGWDGKEGDLRKEKDGQRRMFRGLERLRGLIGLTCRMLRLPSTRPVPVPIGTVLSLALRMFRLTSDGQTLNHVNPTELALAQTLLPELHMLACAVTGQLTLCVKQALLPHQIQISSYLIFLLEQTASQPAVHLSVLRTLHLFTTHVPPSPAPVAASLLMRATKVALADLGPLLSERPASSASAATTPPALTGSTTGKGKGKKRTHGADGGFLVLESGAHAVSPETSTVILAALALLAQLLPSPALPSSLRTLATRLLLSIALALPQRAAHPVLPAHADIERAVRELLVSGLHTGAEGTMGGEAAWVLPLSSILDAKAALLLHPLLPALPRALPSAESLLFYRPEGKNERTARADIDIGCEGDATDPFAVSGTQDASMEGVPITHQPRAPRAAPVAPAPVIVVGSGDAQSGSGGGIFDLPASAAPVVPAAATEVPTTLVPSTPVTFPSMVASADAVDSSMEAEGDHEAIFTSPRLAVASKATAASAKPNKLWEEPPVEDSDGEIPEIDMDGDSSDEEDDE